MEYSLPLLIFQLPGPMYPNSQCPVQVRMANKKKAKEKNPKSILSTKQMTDSPLHRGSYS